jgi:tetratricopeptide (TPR) repeat protein
MQPSSRTPEGEPGRCSICGKEFCLDPSRPPGDAPCPNCGSLTWFGPRPKGPSQSADPARSDALLRHGCKAIEEGNFDYAVHLLRAIVRRAPDRLDYRKALRKAEFAKVGHTKPLPHLLGITTAGARSSLFRAKKRGDWEAVEAAAEDCLAANPFDGEMHLELGNAFRERNMRDHAIFAFECAYAILPMRSDIRETIEEMMRG